MSPHWRGFLRQTAQGLLILPVKTSRDLDQLRNKSTIILGFLRWVFVPED